ncbi:AraC family transcriptional regulator [Actinomycetospora chibensis]|uniref:AraC family transcriptional regulator n=1 Tax=Actinomycetospora chibensis TaxID=663606 RepID=A0ABV9RIY9_9PSEU|nr:AraC family transcriptional regulator [Actinomycetospora chibensis]MDD7927015.1 AraC family transcriptional regulator [Actinomycetospora chibensis]
MGFPRIPGAPPVAVERWSDATARRAAVVGGAHAHDFLVLLHVERGRGPVRVDDRVWELEDGDVLVIAPGAVVAPPEDRVSADALMWAVFFPADAVDPAGVAPLVSWRAHPLLAPFSGGRAGRFGGGQRLRVPPDERSAWRAELEALATELAQRREGVAEAVRAHLTLLLVRLGRLEVDVAGALADRPVLAAVFDVLERRFAEPITPVDVAREVGLTPGHLTTLVGRDTGRTVGQWLTERRMREARRLLTSDDLTVAAIAPRVGYRDPGYFVRRFRREHGVPPQTWRRAGEAAT